jgi:DNA modification methylase
MIELLQGNCLEVLPTLAAESVQCVVTSPPYYGLRSYLDDNDSLKSHELGCEPTPEAYVANLVALFREIRRVLRDDGTVWLNLGDSYAGNGAFSQGATDADIRHATVGALLSKAQRRIGAVDNLKPKNLMGIPWRVAFALQADGWWLRQDIIWAKPNPMPESVTDRCTKSHEYIFLLTKSARYYYDSEAIKEPGAVIEGNVRNRRDVWTVATRPYAEAHFATYPPELVEPCIKAGSKPGDIVLDPFNGAGTTGLVAIEQGRSYIGIELNPEYIELTRKRFNGAQPVLIP